MSVCYPCIGLPTPNLMIFRIGMIAGMHRYTIRSHNCIMLYVENLFIDENFQSKNRKLVVPFGQAWYKSRQKAEIETENKKRLNKRHQSRLASGCWQRCWEFPAFEYSPSVSDGGIWGSRASEAGGMQGIWHPTIYVGILICISSLEKSNT